MPKEIIDIPKYGIINVHSSLLPKYRGASPIHSAILNGDTETGVSIMYIEEGLDSGDVILKEYCKIAEDDTLGTLHDKLKNLGAVGLEKALKLIENGEVQAEKQDDSKATLVKPITKEQAKINWNSTKEVIYNQIRGLNPFPAAHTSNEKGENIKIYKSEKIEKKYEDEIDNGTIVEIINKKVDTSKNMMVALQRFGLEDIQKLLDVCQEYNREHPTEMWLIYDAQKNSLDSRYSYEGRYDKDEELLPRLEFEKWFEEVKGEKL